VRESYPAPQSADFIGGSLVPAARQCGTGANPATGAHSPPLATPSCAPATTGTAHFGAGTAATAQMTVTPGNPATQVNEADVAYTVIATDIRNTSPTGTDYDPNPSGPDMTLVHRLRVTDFQNGATSDAGTTTDLDFSAPVTCVSTAGAGGSNCNANTTANAVMPGAIQENRRMTIQVFRTRLIDSGPNGIRDDGDDTLFAQQGVYIP
jgi:hypothetical protein